MDSIALQTLRDEILTDCQVAIEAQRTTSKRFETGEIAGYEACAHHLCRMYNAIEQMGLRIAKAFENNIDDEQGWHTALLGRLASRFWERGRPWSRRISNSPCGNCGRSALSSSMLINSNSIPKSSSCF